MEATPDVYRADIAHTRHHIALIDADLAGDISSWWPGFVQEHLARRALLVQQLANLQRGLARAEVLWAQAHGDGAGRQIGAVR